MASRKDEKARLREEREERERAAAAGARRKRLVGYGAAGVLGVATLVALIAVALAGGDGGDGGDGVGGGAQGGGDLFPAGGDVPQSRGVDVGQAAELAGCGLTDTKSRGEADRFHTEGSSERVKYGDNPPTLGRHWPPGLQAQDGLYSSAPADEALVHTMEHGRIIVWVKPTLPEEVRQTLRALFDEDVYHLVMAPREKMPYAVAATAWNSDPEPGGTGRTLGCPRWNEGVVGALRAFKERHRDRGPEFVN